MKEIEQFSRIPLVTLSISIQLLQTKGSDYLKALISE
jgi:hypothetical protein